MCRVILILGSLLAVLSVASAQDPATAPAYGYKDSYQINVIGNLNIADSVVNITNSGVYTGGHGFICANVYVFDTDEQLVSCCTCPVSRDGAKSLSAQSDLTVNTLTAVAPNSIIVKLVSIVPPGGPTAPETCDPVALPASNFFPPIAPPPGPLGTNGGFAAGMRAWATHIHAVKTTGGGNFQFGTETEFSKVALSHNELVTLSQLCGFVVGNGSGAGVCTTCHAIVQ